MKKVMAVGAVVLDNIGKKENLKTCVEFVHQVVALRTLFVEKLDQIKQDGKTNFRLEGRIRTINDFLDLCYVSSNSAVFLPEADLRAIFVNNPLVNSLKADLGVDLEFILENEIKALVEFVYSQIGIGNDVMVMGVDLDPCLDMYHQRAEEKMGAHKSISALVPQKEKFKSGELALCFQETKSRRYKNRMSPAVMVSPAELRDGAPPRSHLRELYTVINDPSVSISHPKFVLMALANVLNAKGDHFIVGDSGDPDPISFYDVDTKFNIERFLRTYFKDLSPSPFIDPESEQNSPQRKTFFTASLTPDGAGPGDVFGYMGTPFRGAEPASSGRKLRPIGDPSQPGGILPRRYRGGENPTIAGADSGADTSQMSELELALQFLNHVHASNQDLMSGGGYLQVCGHRGRLSLSPYASGDSSGVANPSGHARYVDNLVDLASNLEPEEFLRVFQGIAELKKGVDTPMRPGRYMPDDDPQMNDSTFESAFPESFRETKLDGATSSTFTIDWAAIPGLLREGRRLSMGGASGSVVQKLDFDDDHAVGSAGEPLPTETNPEAPLPDLDLTWDEDDGVSPVAVSMPNERQTMKPFVESCTQLKDRVRELYERYPKLLPKANASYMDRSVDENDIPKDHWLHDVSSKINAFNFEIEEIFANIDSLSAHLNPESPNRRRSIEGKIEEYSGATIAQVEVSVSDFAKSHEKTALELSHELYCLEFKAEFGLYSKLFGLFQLKASDFPTRFEKKGEFERVLGDVLSADNKPNEDRLRQSLQSLQDERATLLCELFAKNIISDFLDPLFVRVDGGDVYEGIRGAINECSRYFRQSPSEDIPDDSSDLIKLRCYEQFISDVDSLKRLYLKISDDVQYGSGTVLERAAKVRAIINNRLKLNSDLEIYTVEDAFKFRDRICVDTAV